MFSTASNENLVLLLTVLPSEDIALIKKIQPTGAILPVSRSLIATQPFGLPISLAIVALVQLLRVLVLSFQTRRRLSKWLESIPCWEWFEATAQTQNALAQLIILSTLSTTTTTQMKWNQINSRRENIASMELRAEPSDLMIELGTRPTTTIFNPMIEWNTSGRCSSFLLSPNLVEPWFNMKLLIFDKCPHRQPSMIEDLSDFIVDFQLRGRCNIGLEIRHHVRSAWTPIRFDCIQLLYPTSTRDIKLVTLRFIRRANNIGEFIRCLVRHQALCTNSRHFV